MRFSKLIPLSLAIAILSCAPCVVAAPDLEPTVQISQNGHTFENISLLTSTTSAYRYYRYRGDAGHPAFGLAKRTATVSLYWDTTTDALSLLFISGADDNGNGNVSVTGLPRTSSLVLSDDPGEFTFSPRKQKLTGNFKYGGSTDGFVLTTPDTIGFTADLKLTPKVKIDALRITDGDPTTTGKFLKLNLSDSLFIRILPPAGQSQNGNGSQGSDSSGNTPGGNVGNPVPEPASLALFTIAISCLLHRRKR